MNLFPRQPSLFALLPLGRSSRTLFSQSGNTAEGLFSPARVFLNKPAQHKGFALSPKAIRIIGRFTGFILAFAWLGWFFRNLF
jgi:hypothetical protein